MSHDLQIDLDVVLPEAHHDHDHCVVDLIAALRATDGVRDAHLVPAAAHEPAQLCLHVDAGSVSLSTVARTARALGVELTARYGHVLWTIDGITHASRAETAAALLRRVVGVVDASVTVGGAARIEFDRQQVDEDRLEEAAREAGVPVRAPRPPAAEIGHEHRPAADAHAGHDHAADGHAGGRELMVALVAAAVYVVARTLDWTADSDTLPTALYVVAAGATGAMVSRDVLGTLRARRFDIELLMLVAAVGAAILGHWSDAALLLVLFSLGHALEGYAMGRARREIASLSELAPSTARRRVADDVEEVPVEQVRPADVLVVRPHERIPADGIVLTGVTSVDEAPVTGESVPVDKAPADAALLGASFEAVPRLHRVFSGTLNGPGAIDVHVVRAAGDSTIARVIQMVADAETQVSPSQQLTRRIVRVFVPAVLALVALLLLVPPILGEPFDESFLRAMAVLVAASPCALAIATPSAVLAAIARAAKGGVLVKGGGPLEDLGRVNTLAFDKTGTLTEGRPQLVAVAPSAEASEDELLEVALAIESSSDHPLARAITTGAGQRRPGLRRLAATEVRAVMGMGVTGTVEGAAVTIGNAALFDGSLPADILSTKDELERAGRTTMIVRSGDRYLGVLGVMDAPRAEAKDAIAALLALGISRIVMLSGDQQPVADAVAAQVGVPEARGGLLPEAKVDAIRELAGPDGRGVAMVGDGVNDAPALATASVGIAMGAAGNDVALETADIALMADRLDRLPFAVGLARRASSVIRQNLFFSLGVVAVLIPLTIMGVGIGAAVIAHEGSTLVVVANALLLLRYDRGGDHSS